MLESGGGTLDDYYRARREIARLGEAAVPALCDAIARNAESQPTVVDNCCDLLAELHAPAAVTYLVDLLDHPDPNVSIKAVDALRRIHDPRAIPALVKHAEAAPEAGRAPLLRALGVFQDEAAARVVCANLADDRSLETRLLAIELEGGMGPAACVGEIEQLAADPDERLRLEAAGALLRLGRDEKAIPVLRNAVGSGTNETRGRAITLLAQSGRPAAIAILEDLASSTEPLRAVVASALAANPGAGKETLRRLARDSDPTVAATARLALVKGGDAETRDALLHDLEEGSSEAKHRALEVLVQVRAPEAVEPLVRWAKSTDDAAERRAVIRALVTIGDARALPFFMQAFLTSGDDPESSVEAQRALANLGEVSLPALEREYLARLSDPSVTLRLRIVRTLGLIARDETLALLERLFRAESDPGLRMALRTTARGLRRYL
jgi:HEAT repeat protein